MKIHSLCVAFTLATLSAACGGGTDNLPPPPPPPPASPEPPVAPTASAEPANDKPAAPPVTLVVAEASPNPEAPLPSVKIGAPAKDAVLKADAAGDTVVKLDVKNWSTAAGEAHVHLILDDHPYKRIDDPKLPVKLSELTEGKPLAEGEHLLYAFASRKNHESVKTKGALFAVRFFVGKKEAKTDVAKAPQLIYSRPKGAYNGADTKSVLIDFQLLNAELGEGKHSVAIEVTGPGIEAPLTQRVTTFGPPLALKDVRAGSYTVKAELHDKDGKLVPGPYNSTTRSFTADPAAQAEGHGGHGAPPAK